MGSFKINFKLQKLNKIKPFGEKGGYSLGWFGLTDGLLWISVGGQTIYEYGKEARKRFHHCKKYNDYYLAEKPSKSGVFGGFFYFVLLTSY